ncbi:MAG: hypothetical protein ACYTHJ_09175 [Planctomycetota bacterium]|jgi:hypothetical protein
MTLSIDELKHYLLLRHLERSVGLTRGKHLSRTINLRALATATERLARAGHTSRHRGYRVRLLMRLNGQNASTRLREESEILQIWNHIDIDIVPGIRRINKHHARRRSARFRFVPCRYARLPGVTGQEELLRIAPPAWLYVPSILRAVNSAVPSQPRPSEPRPSEPRA